MLAHFKHVEIKNNNDTLFYYVVFDNSVNGDDSAKIGENQIINPQMKVNS